MLPHFRRRARQISLLGIGTIAAGLCLLAPAVTSAHGAHGKARLQPGVPTAGPLQESTASNPPAATGPSTEPPAKTPREERRARREAATGAGAQCSVSLEATPSTVATGAPLSLAGTLTCSEAASAAGQTVTLYQKVAHVPGFSTAATATTEANGTFELALSGPEANSVFFVVCDGAKSARTSVKVAAPQLVIETPTAGTQLFAVGAGAINSTVSDGKPDAGPVTFTGTAGTADAGAAVVLQREYRKEAWHRIGVGLIDAEGGFSITHTFHRAGEANIRVVVRHSHGLYVNSVSAPVTYQISRSRQ
jgi:hypothetical protein